MGAAALKPPLAIPPRSKLWGFLAFSREEGAKAMDAPDNIYGGMKNGDADDEIRWNLGRQSGGPISSC